MTGQQGGLKLWFLSCPPSSPPPPHPRLPLAPAPWRERPTELWRIFMSEGEQLVWDHSAKEGGREWGMARGREKRENRGRRGDKGRDRGCILMFVFKLPATWWLIKSNYLLLFLCLSMCLHTCNISLFYGCTTIEENWLLLGATRGQSGFWTRI